MTSSPSTTPIASSASTSASVPFATPIACRTPRYAAASSSKDWTLGPRMNRPESRTSAIRSFSSSSSGAYCARTSTSGICGTTSQSRRPSVTKIQIDQARDDQGSDGVVDVVPGVIEALVAATEPVADGGEPEAPGHAAEKG